MSSTTEFGHIPIGVPKGPVVYPHPEFQAWLRTVLDRTGGAAGSSIQGVAPNAVAAQSQPDLSPVSQQAMPGADLAPVMINDMMNELEPV